MKRILSVVLVAGLILSFAACGDEAKEEKKTASDSPFANINTDAPELEKPDKVKADKKEQTKEAEKTEEDSGSSSPFAKINTDAPQIEAPETVKASDARIDFEVTAPEIDAVEPVKPKDAKFEFEAADFDLNLSANVTEYELAEFEGMSIDEKEYILERKASLLTALASEFDKVGIDVMINEISGEIIMDSSILFANDDATVSEKGKDLVKQFIKAYASVVCDDEYDDFVSGVIIEGHTDTNGSYDYNKTLSEKRAGNVEKICLSDDVDVSSDVMKSLKSKLSSAGCSYDRPIKNSDGSVNMDASRRVSFRFLINID